VPIQERRRRLISQWREIVSLLERHIDGIEETEDKIAL
jgi:hypothetical protein